LEASLPGGYPVWKLPCLEATDGVDPGSKDKNGRTPPWPATRQGHGAVVKLLLATDRVDIDSKDDYGQTPLLWAAKVGIKAMVQILLDNGADFHAQGGEYGNALQAALAGGHE
jgi:ankyrin repeat protein